MLPVESVRNFGQACKPPAPGVEHELCAHAQARCSAPTWLPAGWTSRTCTGLCSTTRRRTPPPSCTALAAPPAWVSNWED